MTQQLMVETDSHLGLSVNLPAILDSVINIQSKLCIDPSSA